MTDASSAILCGSFAGVCATLVGAPFDTIKVRLQTGGQMYTSMVECAAKVLREEKPSSLYKGVVPAMTSAVVENATVFMANSVIKSAYTYVTKKPAESLSLNQLALVGGLSGVFSSTAICPAETIKCRMQAANMAALNGSVKARKANVFSVTSSLIKSEGLRGLYRGLPALYARDIPFNFFFFGGYETACHLMCMSTGRMMKSELKPLETIFCGGMAGVIAWSACIPADVIKSRMQASNVPLNLLETVKGVYKQGGVLAFYKGWGAAVVRAFPVNGVLFVTYEFADRQLQAWVL